MNFAFQRYKNNDGRGFTLIELLVVIAIIGLLASIVLASMSRARMKSQDVAVQETLRQLQKALELYYNDNGSYPNTFGAWHTEANYGPVAPYNNLGYSGPTGWIPDLAPKYIDRLPTAGQFLNRAGDPSYCPANYAGYFYDSNGTDYKIKAACMVQTELVTTNSQFYDPQGLRPYTYTIYTPGAASW